MTVRGIGARGWRALGGSGALLMVLGTGALAAGAYVMLACANRAMAATEYGHFSVFWSAFLIGGGSLAVPLETMLVRVSGTGTEGSTLGAARRARWLLSAAAVLGATVLVLVDREAFQRPGTAIALLATVVWIVMAPHRGRVAAAHRFGMWCVLTSVEGVARAAGSLVLLLAGTTSDTLWSLAILVPIASSGVALAFMRTEWLVVQVPVAEAGRPLPWLISAGLGQQVIMNAGPVLVTVGSSSLSVAAAGAYLNTLSLARAPQLPIYGLQGAWAPRFAAVLADDPRGANRSLRVHMVTLGAVLAALSLLTVAVSPLLMLLLTGQATVPMRLLVTLLLVTALVSGSQSLTLAANAEGKEAGAAKAWLGAGLALVVVGGLSRGVAGVALANLVVVAGLAAVLAHQLRSRGLPRRENPGGETEGPPVG